ncbi:MAG: metal ABC transporter permease [SAR202 cluster bacterium]|nr:metal ABC transporter permease [SAR202 cluster bacterium]
MEILQYDFMVRALIAGAIVGAMAPAIGIFLVLRRLSMIADSLSHVALAGVAVGLLLKTFPPIAALGATSVAAVTIEQLRARRMMPGDAALAIMLYTALALSVVIISLAGGFNVDLFSYLFGSVLTIDWADLWLVGALGALIIGFVVIFYSELAQTSFDNDLAITTGVPVNAVNLGLAILTGATITLSMRVVGVLLVGAMLVIPVIAGIRLAKGLRSAIALAMLIGVVSSVSGLIIAFYADLAAGGAVVLTSVVVLLVTVGASSGLARVRRTRALRGGAEEAVSATVSSAQR